MKPHQAGAQMCSGHSRRSAAGSPRGAPRRIAHPTAAGSAAEGDKGPRDAHPRRPTSAAYARRRVNATRSTPSRCRAQAAGPPVAAHGTPPQAPPACPAHTHTPALRRRRQSSHPRKEARRHHRRQSEPRRPHRGSAPAREREHALALVDAVDRPACAHLSRQLVGEQSRARSDIEHPLPLSKRQCRAHRTTLLDDIRRHVRRLVPPRSHLVELQRAAHPEILSRVPRSRQRLRWRRGTRASSVQMSPSARIASTPSQACRRGRWAHHGGRTGGRSGLALPRSLAKEPSAPAWTR